MKNEISNSDSLTFYFPLPRVHLGMPMSNSRMGALVFGGERHLKICVCETSNFDHRYGEKLWGPRPYRELLQFYDPYNVESLNEFLQKLQRPHPFGWQSTRLGGGRIVYELADELGSITLSYDTGIVEVKTVNGRILKLILSVDSNDLLIFDPEHLIVEESALPMYERFEKTLSQVGIMPPLRWSNTERCGWFQPLPEDLGLQAESVHTEYGRLIQVNLCETSRTFPEPNPQSVESRTSAWFSDYWSRAASIELPEPFFNRFFRFALYKFAISTMPGGKAASLQGPFLEDYQLPAWQCDYHFNINIQQIYTLAFSIGHPEHLLPLFDMLESPEFQQNMHDNARSLFGIDDGILLTHAVDDRGMQCGGISVGSVLDFACTGWVATLYFDYYRYTLDRDFLRERAWRFMYQTMRMLESALVFENGCYRLPLSISAEYGCIFPVKKDGKLCRQNSGANPTGQLVCIHRLLNCLVEAARILERKLPGVWLDIRKKLPKLTSDEEKVILWEGQDLDVCHRHHTHLSMIYPFDIMENMTQEELRKIDQAVDHWISLGMGQWSEWCYPWAAIIQARLGFRESPGQLLNLWRSLFINESLATVYLPRYRGLSAHRRNDMMKPLEDHEIMQLDGTMAGATALTELLVQRHGKRIKLFPAVPENWKDIRFFNLCLPGGLKVSAELRDGHIFSGEFFSIPGEEIEVEVEKHLFRISLPAGQATSLP